jgi:hypothetical protein
MFKKIKFLFPGTYYKVYDESRDRYLEIWKQWFGFKWDVIKIQVVNRRAVNGRK